MRRSLRYCTGNSQGAPPQYSQRLCETPPPSPLPEAERGSKTTALLPLSASGRGLGGGVLGPAKPATATHQDRPVMTISHLTACSLALTLLASPLALAGPTGAGDSKPGPQGQAN